MLRAVKPKGGCKAIAFKVIPIIIVVAALLTVFSNKAHRRVTSSTIIALMTYILLVDSTANVRIEAYKEQLELENR